MRVGRAAGLTDTGRRRLQNEDAFVCEPPLFAVADGMGGARAGELASSLAATALEERAAAVTGEEQIARLLRDANATIFERALRDPATAGMGTTTTVAVVEEREGRITIGHVGDSRAYRVRQGALEQLTADHSLVGELIRSGRLTHEEAITHPHRSVITRALGTDADVEVDTLTLELEPGDLFLLCSDGLPAMVRDATILERIVATGGAPSEAANALVAAANSAGGVDNVTVVLFEVIEGEPAARPQAPTPRAAPQELATTEIVPVAAIDDDVRRHGAGDGSRWPALLFIIALAIVAALAVWWTLR